MALHTWWLFAVTVFFISISPGPNMLHVMQRSVALGFARAMMAMSGCFLAVLTLLSLSAAGLSAVLVAMPQLFAALKIVGAGYLLYLGYRAVGGIPKEAMDFFQELIGLAMKSF